MDTQLHELIEQARDRQADKTPAPWPFEHATDYWAGLADGLEMARDLLAGKDVTLPVSRGTTP